VKSKLGADAANECGDDAKEQEAAIGNAEAWVADAVSGDRQKEVAAILWLEGPKDGARIIRAAVKSASRARP
jgi:hypothetical protein